MIYGNVSQPHLSWHVKLIFVYIEAHLSLGNSTTIALQLISLVDQTLNNSVAPLLNKCGAVCIQCSLSIDLSLQQYTPPDFNVSFNANKPVSVPHWCDYIQT